MLSIFSIFNCLNNGSEWVRGLTPDMILTIFFFVKLWGDLYMWHTHFPRHDYNNIDKDR